MDSSKAQRCPWLSALGRNQLRYGDHAGRQGFQLPCELPPPPPSNHYTRLSTAAPLQPADSARIAWAAHHCPTTHLLAAARASIMIVNKVALRNRTPPTMPAFCRAVAIDFPPADLEPHLDCTKLDAALRVLILCSNFHSKLMKHPAFTTEVWLHDPDLSRSGVLFF